MKSTKPASKSSEDRNKNVRLVKIDTDNFDAMTHLSVDDTQKGFLVENIYSLAEAYATLAEGRFVQCFGIYDKEIPVGFLMIGYDYTSCCRGEVPDFIRNSYNIWRLMIDKNFQNNISGHSPAEKQNTAGFPTNRKTRQQNSCIAPSVLRKDPSGTWKAVKCRLY